MTHLITLFVFIIFFFVIILTRVLTGLRLLKKDRIIHIFASERKLGPNGRIEVTNPDDQTWISDYNFVIEDSGVEEGKDYHTLTWKDRSIELDTIRAAKDEVVTGARFRIINNRLRFEIRKYAIVFFLSPFCIINQFIFK